MAITKRPANPITYPMPDHILNGYPYPVKNKDSWWSIAVDKKVDVRALVYFNFRTNNPDEINWYLHEKVGCQSQTKDSKNYIFTAADRPGVIYIPNTPQPTPPCPNAISQADANELEGALRTKARSIEVTGRFFRTVGAVGRHGRFISTIIDTKFWFAKLYEIITTFEISASRDYKHPAFVLHFIPVFYDMYYEALENWTNGAKGAVSMLWQNHFNNTGRPDQDSIMSWSAGVQSSIITGVAAHIAGDMPTALERAYRTYVTKYCLDPAPPFDDFHDDFFAMGDVFEQVRAATMSLIASLGPVPEAGVKIGDSMGMGLDVGQINKWRAGAWEEARKRLGQ